MARYIKIIKGRRYWYEQTPDYKGGKRTPITRYVGPVDGPARKKAADEKYREVLRDNVYKYGSSRPGARYASEAAARAEYHRDMGWKANKGHQRWADEASRTRSPEEREADAQYRHMMDKAAEEHRVWEREHTRTPATEAARERYMDLKAKVEAEVHEEARQTTQNAPGRTQEAPAKNFTVDDEIDAREAKFHATQEEVNAARGYDPAPTEAPVDDAPAPVSAEPDQPSEPEGGAAPGSSSEP